MKIADRNSEGHAGDTPITVLVAASIAAFDFNRQVVEEVQVYPRGA